ncbi:MAG: DGQHR domain-containing protein [Pseudomonadota bacterium]|jgi:hypothetical protein|nr:hypothetical protein [Rhodocyclaceae bacterium]
MSQRKRIPLLKVPQWLQSWGAGGWHPDDDLGEPPHHFYVGAMPLRILHALSGVRRRDVQARRQAHPQPGYQRAHDDRRSRDIARYIQYGYPLSSQSTLDPDEHRHLIHPGWLPGAILVNLIPEGVTRARGGKDLALLPKNAAHIDEVDGNAFLMLPDESDGKNPVPEDELAPFEVIDGQHRLYAIAEGFDPGDDYCVPVVFFDNLSPAWQAYLFWVINVEPKKINPSLAFDLYPELRSQQWLESGEAIRVYREHRAQELTEILWRHPKSPWRERIELFGKRVPGHVSNAAFIRTLTVSFVRPWGREAEIGGLFGAIDRHGKAYVLPWKRAQQAAFLIRIWEKVKEAVDCSEAEWVRACASAKTQSALQIEVEHHPAFAGEYSLLATDQGVRAISVVFNAICQSNYEALELDAWQSDEISETTDDATVTNSLGELDKLVAINTFLAKVSKALIDDFDWRTSSFPGLAPEKRDAQSVYRGSSGYSALQRKLMRVLCDAEDVEVAHAAKEAVSLLRWPMEEGGSR